MRYHGDGVGGRGGWGSVAQNVLDRCFVFTSWLIGAFRLIKGFWASYISSSQERKKEPLKNKIRRRRRVGNLFTCYAFYHALILIFFLDVGGGCLALHHNLESHGFEFNPGLHNHKTPIVQYRTFLFLPLEN